MPGRRFPSSLDRRDPQRALGRRSNGRIRSGSPLGSRGTASLEFGEMRDRRHQRCPDLRSCRRVHAASAVVVAPLVRIQRSRAFDSSWRPAITPVIRGMAMTFLPPSARPDHVVKLRSFQILGP
jgi:hypothetical protein